MEIINKFEKKFETKENNKDVEFILEYEVNQRDEVKRVKITKILYPLECCSNNMQTIIEIKEGLIEPYRIEVYDIRNEWNGTGRDDLMSIEFNDYGYEVPSFLDINVLEKINSVKQLKEFIRDIMAVSYTHL